MVNIKKLFEKARRDIEQEENQTYGIYLNKEAMKKACEKEDLKPKELITKILKEWLVLKGRTAFYHRRHRKICLKNSRLVRENTDLKIEIEKLKKRV